MWGQGNVIDQLSNSSNTIRTKEDGGGFVKRSVFNSTIIEDFGIEMSFPNPFNPSTTINYHIPHQGSIKIDIFDINGILVRSYNENHVQEGRYSITWDGLNNNKSHSPSGLYFATFTYNTTKNPLASKIQTIKLSLIK